MGFFSDLKEDLSQTVNGSRPERAFDAAMAGDAEMRDMLSDEQLTNEFPMQDRPSEAVNSVDLSSMLDKLEETGTTDESLEEATISFDGMAEAADDTSAIMATEPVIAEEPEPIAEELVLASETEIEADNITSELSGEEEKSMDEQTQVQAQAKRVLVDETAIVTGGMTITGDILSEGSMELIGTVNGNLDILGKLNVTGNINGDSKAAEIYADGARITGEINSQGSVKIGQSSVVIGNVIASSAVIAGAVKGDIDVHGPVILDTTAIVMGNIKSRSVQINNGALIEGLCSQCYADVNPTTFFEEFKKKEG